MHYGLTEPLAKGISEKDRKSAENARSLLSDMVNSDPTAMDKITQIFYTLTSPGPPHRWGPTRPPQVKLNADQKENAKLLLTIFRCL